MEMDVSFEFAGTLIDLNPAPTNMTIRKLIASSAEELGVSYQLMPSGAGHDSDRHS